MTTYKRLFILFLVLVNLCVLLVPVSAHDGICSADEISVFDWERYEETLANIEYRLRLSEDMTDKADEYIKLLLVADGVVPADAMSEENINEDVFLSFVEKNVDITYFSERARASICCDNMQKIWVGVVVLPTFNANNWCIKHTFYEQQQCSACGAVWNTRSTAYAGCGGYRYSGYGYAVCPNAQYLNY